ncbi:MAG: ATP-binding cassette domain-containing protein [Firmicutes bacterium]|nr:ATP-binding cassette domain-containing protein [Bacillota bacterium]
MEILDVKNLTFSYAGCDSAAIENISFSANEGDFIFVSGGTGSGKSTLLRALKRELCPNGELSGEIKILGRPRDELDVKDSASLVGFVPQHAEEAIVTDTVSHELAFGLENLGVTPDAIRRRAAEISAFFGMNGIYSAKTHTISGGQKQMLVLASVMIMRPKILLLDEPTSELDPVAVGDFTSMLSRINRELGTTIILSEHRLESALYLSNKMLALDGGRELYFGGVRKAVFDAASRGKFSDMPASVKIFMQTGGVSEEDMPITIAEGREYIRGSFGNKIKEPDATPKNEPGSAALTLKNVFFRYERDGSDVLSGLDLSIREGDCTAILGGNGAGKSTLLSVAAGLSRPYSGAVRVFGKKLTEYKNGTLYRGCISMLPQNVEACFLYSTVGEELSKCGYRDGTLGFDFEPIKNRHPYDISGGEAQLLALAKAVASSPRLLLLDEPTKGLDGEMKEIMKCELARLKGDGVTVMLVTHDAEFAAETADTVSMIFDGKIVSSGAPREFFSENEFYTTPTARMTRGHYERAVTVGDAVTLCRKNVRVR